MAGLAIASLMGGVASRDAAKRRGRGVFVSHGALNVVKLVPASDTDTAMAEPDNRETDSHRSALPLRSKSSWSRLDMRPWKAGRRLRAPESPKA